MKQREIVYTGPKTDIDHSRYFTGYWYSNCTQKCSDMDNSQCNLTNNNIHIFFSVDDLVLALYPPTDHQAVVENVSIWNLQIVIDFDAGKRSLRITLRSRTTSKIGAMLDLISLVLKRRHHSKTYPIQANCDRSYTT